MKYLHAQIAVLGKDPSQNLKCVSYTPYTQSLKVISYSPFRDLDFSVTQHKEQVWNSVSIELRKFQISDFHS